MLLSLFLKDDFWTLKTNETNTYAHRLFVTQTVKSKKKKKDLIEMLILTDMLIFLVLMRIK